MKVKELIQELQKYNLENEIIFHNDEKLQFLESIETVLISKSKDSFYTQKGISYLREKIESWKEPQDITCAVLLK